MYGLAALTVGVSSIPLLFILWRVLKAPTDLHPPHFLGLALKIRRGSALPATS